MSGGGIRPQAGQRPASSASLSRPEPSRFIIHRLLRRIEIKMSALEDDLLAVGRDAEPVRRPSPSPAEGVNWVTLASRSRTRKCRSRCPGVEIAYREEETRPVRQPFDVVHILGRIGVDEYQQRATARRCPRVFR